MLNSEELRAKEIALNASMRMNEPKTAPRSQSIGDINPPVEVYDIAKVISDAELIYQFITN